MTMTYADEKATEEVLKKKHFKIPLYKPIPKETEPFTEVNDALTRPDRGEEISCDVQISQMKLTEVLRKRMNDTLRTNETARVLINKRMLRGFTGFHGELTSYWDQVAAETRKSTVSRMAEDNLRNERQKDASRQKKRNKWEEYKERQASKGRRDEIEEGGRITTEGKKLAERLKYEATGSEDQSEAPNPETSNIAQGKEGIPEAVESVSERLENVAEDLTDSRSELGPAIVEIPIEEIKTTASTVDDSPANVQVSEEPAIVEDGVNVESILDRFDHGLQSLSNLPSGKASPMNVETNSHSTSGPVEVIHEDVSVPALDAADVEIASTTIDEPDRSLLAAIRMQARTGSGMK
jgi:hypothetical protein